MKRLRNGIQLEPSKKLIGCSSCWWLLLLWNAGASYVECFQSKYATFACATCECDVEHRRTNGKTCFLRNSNMMRHVRHFQFGSYFSRWLIYYYYCGLSEFVSVTAIIWFHVPPKSVQIRISLTSYCHNINWTIVDDVLSSICFFRFYIASRSAPTTKIHPYTPSNYLTQSALIDIRFSENRGKKTIVCGTGTGRLICNRMKIMFSFFQRKMLRRYPIIICVLIYVIWFSFSSGIFHFIRCDDTMKAENGETAKRIRTGRCEKKGHELAQMISI